jgi:hypothetical protein
MALSYCMTMGQYRVLHFQGSFMSAIHKRRRVMAEGKYVFALSEAKEKVTHGGAGLFRI